MRVKRIVVGLIASLWAMPLFADGFGIQMYMTCNDEPCEGNYTCTFSLFDGESATTPLCSTTTSLELVGGVSEALIGGDADCPTAADLPYDLYIGAQCDEENLLPRVAARAVPFALHAEVADAVLSEGITLSGGNIEVNGVTISPEELARLDGVLAPLVTTGDTGTVTSAMLATNSVDADEIAPASVGASEVTVDFLDFIHFEDALDLDANLTIAQGGYTWAHTYTGAGAAMTVDATGGGVAVLGQTTTGTGVKGSATDATGIAGYFVNTSGEALYVNGGLRLKRTAVTCNGTAYEVRAEDHIVACNPLTAATVVRLPAPSTSNIGRQIFVKDEAGAATTTNKIIVQVDGGTHIEGAATQEITTLYGKIPLYSTGTNWVKR